MHCQLAVLLLAVAAAIAGPVPAHEVHHGTVPMVPEVHALAAAPHSAIKPSQLLKNSWLRDPGNANAYIDYVLRNLNKLLPSRVEIPDIGTPLNLHNCAMIGLDNGITRAGDATMVTVGQTVKFTSAFATSTVGITCDWKLMLLRGTVTGTTDAITISSGISLELVSGASPILTEFRVTEMAPIKIDVTGLTFLFNWLAEDIANMVVGSYQDQMVAIMETVVKTLLEQVLGAIVLP